MIEITEIHLENEFGNQLKISGTTNKDEALEAAIHWADENNCTITDITSDEEGIHIAVVCSDDYE